MYGDVVCDGLTDGEAAQLDRTTRRALRAVNRSSAAAALVSR